MTNSTKSAARQTTCEGITGLGKILDSAPTLAAYRAAHGSISYTRQIEASPESAAARSIDLIVGEAHHRPAHNGSSSAERHAAAVAILHHVYESLAPSHRARFGMYPESRRPEMLGFTDEFAAIVLG